MADFFFFTDFDLLSNQSQDQAFGPILNTSDPLFSATEDRFRVTDSHTATSNPQAYAICKSIILVQPYVENNVVNANYVNIILKPLDQPTGLAPKIKFIIYRGILKNSLTDGTNIVSPPTTTFTKFITDNSTDLSDDILGLQLYNQTNYNDSDLIENAFYKSNAINWEVYGGWSIGIFDKDKMGIDIILDSVHFNPTFKIARLPVNYISSLKPPTSPSQADLFEHWNNKESLLYYIDPAAFYGNFFKEGFFARLSTQPVNATTLTPEFDKKKEKKIYRDILEGGTLSTPKVLFFNKNYAYLDIRNELNDSINFMKNYSVIDPLITENSILISDDNINTDLQDPTRNPIPAIDYYNRGNWKWPLLRISKITTSNGSDFNLSSGTSNTNVLKIALPIGNTGGLIENPSPLCYVSVGNQIGNRQKFFEFQVDTVNTERFFTKNALKIELNNYEDDTSGNKPLISSYVKLKFLKQTPDGGNTRKSEGTIIRSIYYLDNLFLPNAMYVPYIGSEKIKINTYEDETFVCGTNDLNRNYIAKTGIVKDQFDFTFFASALDIYNGGKSSPSGIFSISSETNNTESRFISLIDKKLEKNCLRESAISLNLPTLTTIQLLKFVDKVDSSLFSFLKRSNIPDVNTDIISFSLSPSDYQTLQSLIVSENFLTGSKIYLGIGKRNDKDIDPGNDKDLNNKNYLSFNLILRGYKTNGGITSVHEKDTGITLYGFTSSEAITKN